MTCMLGEKTFYESGEDTKSRIAQLVADLPVADVLKVALDSKEKMKLRHVPLFVIREAMRKLSARVEAGTALTSIISRPDDMTEFVAMYFAGEKKRITLPKQARKAIAKAFEKFDEYQLSKYKKSDKQVSLRDVLRLVHPSTKDKALSALWGRLAKDELATPDTWEVQLSAGGDKKEVFTRLIDENKLGAMALLRNLRNMKEAGIDTGYIKKAILNIKTDKLLPKDLVMAYFYNPEFGKEIEKKFFELFDNNQTKIDESTAVIIDCSGSMSATLSEKSQMTRNNAGVSLGILCQEMFNDSDIYAFGTDCKHVPYSRGFSMFKKVSEANVGHSTMIGEAMRHVMSNRKYKRVIVITDEQGHDTITLPKGTRGYMINTAPYKNSVAFGKWVRIDGWSENVLDFICEYEEQFPISE